MGTRGKGEMAATHITRTHLVRRHPMREGPEAHPPSGTKRLGVAVQAWSSRRLSNNHDAKTTRNDRADRHAQTATCRPQENGYQRPRARRGN